MILKLLNKTVAWAYELTGTWRQALEVDLKVGSKLRKWSGKEDVALGEDRKVRDCANNQPGSFKLPYIFIKRHYMYLKKKNLKSFVPCPI
jgi:hypothetical protein